MSNGIIKISCDGIMCDSEHEVFIPNWIGDREYGQDGSYLFCDKPSCRNQHEWFRAQCPGCVAGYPDCGLSKSFAYSHNRTITVDQLSTIRQGKCPFRVNGTFIVFQDKTGNKIQSEDISKRADTESGNAVADAIIEYVNTYPAESQR